MRLLILALGLPLLLANGFPAENYELAARFARTLMKGDTVSAGKHLAPDANLHNWASAPKTLADLTEYFNGCALKAIRGNFDRNINIDLDCSSEPRSASVHFAGLKISEVAFGPPPPRPVIVRQPVGNK